MSIAVLISCDSRVRPRAPLLDGMGAFHRPIATDVELAQRYFNQGLVLAYAFNHGEAARSFREAARQDPDCAMCSWGLALSLGPNINSAMDPENNPEAIVAIRRAVELSENGPAIERALIEALSLRYQHPAPEDRSSLDLRYAEAMRDVYEKFPDDQDVPTLFADAWMNTMPWAYWTEDGRPKPRTTDTMVALEGFLERYPQHPGANHLYIHLVESAHPERGVEAAERLGTLVPGAGHLVHMPSHIFLRVGRYHDASLANQAAIEADQRYDAQCRAVGLYPVVYMPHNEHFLWASATAEGRSKVAITAARQLAQSVDETKMRESDFGTLQHFWVTPLYAMVRFGKWGDILLTPEPDDDLVYPRGVWHYARAIAFVRTARFDEAAAEIEALTQIAADPALEEVTIWDLNTTAQLIAIAHRTARAELLAAQRRLDEAIELLREAVEIEESLHYDEPPPWHAPVRQTLGVVLLVAGRIPEAEAVYREDLERNPQNGWSLFGLLQSLRLQRDTDRMESARVNFDRAWQHADIELASSRM